MNGYAKYEKLMVEWASIKIKPIHRALQNGEKPPPQDTFFEKTFSGFNEISDTMDAIKLTKVFISLSPPRSRRIQKPAYLKYHVTVHLHEVYILKERLNEYATKIKRAYSKSARGIFVSNLIEPLFDVIRESLEPLVSTRSKHVHSARFNDEVLSQASLLSFVDRFGDSEYFKDASRLSYALAQNEWNKIAQSNIDAITNILDSYFNVLFEAITENGLIETPHPR